MSTLITGAGGFIGSPLTERLGARPFTRNDGDIAASRSDLEAACDGVTKLVHLAYPCDYEHPTGEASAMLANVLEVCKRRNIHLFLPSSWRVFDGASGAVTDSMSPAAVTAYGMAKADEERTARESGVRLTIIRLSSVYGPRSKRPAVIRTFTRALRAGDPVRPHKFANGHSRMSLLHVSDAVAGIAEIVERGLQGTFHLAPKTSTTTAELARLIAANLGTDYRQEDDLRPAAARHIDFRPSDGFEARRSLMAGLGEMAFLPV